MLSPRRAGRRDRAGEHDGSRTRKSTPEASRRHRRGCARRRSGARIRAFGRAISGTWAFPGMQPLRVYMLSLPIQVRPSCPRPRPARQSGRTPRPSARRGAGALIITDLDTQAAGTNKSTPPAAGESQTTNNTTLQTWVPGEAAVDALWEMPLERRTLGPAGDPLFAVHVSYQMPVDVTFPGSTVSDTAHPYTFEDALVFKAHRSAAGGKGGPSVRRSAARAAD